MTEPQDQAPLLRRVSFVIAGLEPRDPRFQRLRDDCEAAAQRRFRSMVLGGDTCRDIGGKVDLVVTHVPERLPETYR